ncbi:MAG: polysaccharide pyruvyl transferase family protein [Bacteroidales bacterium]
MMKIVITDVYDLKYNYGVQGLVLPLIRKMKKIADVEFTMPVQSAYYNKPNIEFAEERNIRLLSYWKYSFLIDMLHPFVKFAEKLFFLPGFYKHGKKSGPVNMYRNLVKSVEEADMVIDMAGIEFIGNSGIKKKWGELLFCRMFQKMSQRHATPYFKYTKSYGPLEGFLFRRITKRLLEDLPFLFIRGGNNLEYLRKFNFKTPLYLFPDVSLVLKPASKSDATDYLVSLGIDPAKPVIGISPSRVLSGITSADSNNSVGLNHRELSKRLIGEYKSRGFQVLIIPHAMDRIDPNKCDFHLARELMDETGEKENVFITGEELSYSEVRAVIGLLSFYITGRYHSVASALYMGTPVISLAWHIKYTDIMAEFLDDFLAIDCRKTGIDEAIDLIGKYHNDLSWFDPKKVRYNRRRIDRQVERSVRMVIEYAQITKLEASFRP